MVLSGRGASYEAAEHGTRMGEASLETLGGSGWAESASQKREKRATDARRRSDGGREREGDERREGRKEGKKVGGGWRGRKTNEPRNKRGIGAIDGSGVWPEGNEEGMRGRS